MLKVSVIIPVYNASQFIARCLQSVEQQTIDGLEVILVDDHGRDDSIAIAKTVAAQCKRSDIIWRFVATPVNSGPGAARNLGLQMAEGEYVAFLDADDWVEPDMYDILYTKAVACKAELACCNALQEFEDGRSARILTNPVVPEGVLSVDARKHLLSNFVAYLWTYIYRREWLAANAIAFPDAKSAEDSSFLACCLLTANRIAQTDKPLYHYIIHSGSLTSRRVWKGRDKRRAFRAMLDYAERKQLMATYRWQLWYIYLKKALIVPILEML